MDAAVLMIVLLKSVRSFFMCHFLSILLTFVLIFASLDFVEGSAQCNRVFASEKSVWHPSGGDLFMDLRENNLHYWLWVESLKRESFTKGIYSKGIISGDPNILNFSDVLIDGQRKIRLNDFDDAGSGYVIFEFIKFVTSAKSLSLDLTTAELFEMYLAGLIKDKHEPPTFLKKTLADIDEKKESDSFLKKYTEEGAFKTNNETKLIKVISAPESIQKIFLEDQDVMEKTIKGTIEKSKILDVAYRIKTSGGSAKQPRFWFLVETKKKSKVIIEFKSTVDPVLSELEPQSDFQNRMAEIFQFYWKNDEMNSLYKAVSAKANNYLMRPKYKEFIKFDEIKSEKDKKNARDYLLYLSYHLGRVVARQDNLTSYIKAISNEAEQVFDAVEKLSDDYLDIVKKLRDNF